MKKVVYFFLLPISLGKLLFPVSVLAHCPLCVAGAATGLSFSRFLGVDDTIGGVWMAAFLGATSLWFSNSLKKKYLPFQGFIIYLLIFTTTIISFYRFGLINEHAGLVLNLPKLTFGMVVGGTIFYLVDVVNFFLRKMNENKSFFPYQGLALSLGSMMVLSVLMYFFINYLV